MRVVLLIILVTASRGCEIYKTVIVHSLSKTLNVSIANSESGYQLTCCKEVDKAGAVFNSKLKHGHVISCAQINIILIEPSNSETISREANGTGFVEIFQFHQRSTTVSRIELQVFDQMTHEPMPVDVYHGNVTISALAIPCNDAQTSSGTEVRLNSLFFFKGFFFCYTVWSIILK